MREADNDRRSLAHYVGSGNLDPGSPAGGTQGALHRLNRFRRIWTGCRLPRSLSGGVDDLELGSSHNRDLDDGEQKEQQQRQDEGKLNHGTPPLSHT